MAGILGKKWTVSKDKETSKAIEEINELEKRTREYYLDEIYGLDYLSGDSRYMEEHGNDIKLATDLITYTFNMLRNQQIILEKLNNIENKLDC